ncbi:hypothetical protein [Stakelama marina]|uniref:Lipoprotein n=1 Tax=Stakelama marina TaxID=2826939 RepID=A0A8T4IEA8_9SPHN|nr:hypothetical protein [Stakelama marina]MBR0552184.1 hypothetical protein [Stakelama marina]
MRARIALALTVAMALAGCGGGDDAATQNNSTAIAEPEATPTPEDDGPPVVSPTPAPGSAAVSIPPPPREGRWYIRQDPDGMTAVFGPPKGEGSLSVRCDAPGRQLIFYRLAQPDSEAPVALNLFLPSGNTLLRAFPETEDHPGYYGRMPLREPWLKTLLAARGTIESDLDGRDPLSVPVAPELKQVVAHCRAAQQKGKP